MKKIGKQIQSLFISLLAYYENGIRTNQQIVYDGHGLAPVADNDE
jgi:hypothetical protein